MRPKTQRKRDHPPPATIWQAVAQTPFTQTAVFLAVGPIPEAGRPIMWPRFRSSRGRRPVGSTRTFGHFVLANVGSLQESKFKGSNFASPLLRLQGERWNSPIRRIHDEGCAPA